MDVMVNHSCDPAFNLALEELIAKDFDREIIMLWRNAPAVIVGCNQNTEAEIDPDFIRKNNIAVIRRITGGGAVYHDLGNINFTIALNKRLLEPDAFPQNAQIIIDILQKFNICAQFSGRNDILTDGKKISGSAKSVFHNRTLFHGTLLFDTDLSVLSNALRPDEEKIRAKGIRSVRSRVANLKQYLPYLDRESFFEQLALKLLEATGSKSISPLPPDLVANAEKLADEKYRTWEWNYGTMHNFSYSKKARFQSGSVQINFNIANNLICDFTLSGDFFGNKPAAELAQYFNGLPPRYDLIANRVKALQIGSYIQNLTPEEFLSLFSL